MDDTAELASLLNGLNVCDLGHGDPVVGVNLLAGMACTLSNLAPDDGSVIHPDGSPARVGSSLLVTGGAISGRVVDEIVAEVSHRQNNLISHLESYSGWLERNKGRPGIYPEPTREHADSSVNLIGETQSVCGDISTGHLGSWRRVLEQLPHQSVEQIGKRPKFMVSVGGRKDIESQLNRLRTNNPLVHLGASKPEDLSKYSEVGVALLEGRYPLDDGVRTVKGNILITDPMHMLTAAARIADDGTAWLGQLLWLTDRDTGPDVPTVEHGPAQPSTVKLEQRFREALGRVMTHRLSLPDLPPLVLFCDTRKAMARWSAFLREMEPRLPGITGAARNLLTSLVLGIGLMATRASRITLAGIEAMSRFLVRRMANLRTAILHAGDLARRREQITRIFHKLGAGPADARTLSRHLSINVGERDPSLRWLEATGLIICGQDGWQLREGARLSFTDCTVPILEV